MKEDFRIYYGSLPMPREVITLEIDRHLLRVRVTEISGTANQSVPVHLEYRVLAMEL